MYRPECTAPGGFRPGYAHHTILDVNVSLLKTFTHDVVLSQKMAGFSPRWLRRDERTSFALERERVRAVRVARVVRVIRVLGVGVGVAVAVAAVVVV